MDKMTGEDITLRIATVDEAREFFEEHVKTSKTFKNPDKLRKHCETGSRLIVERTLGIKENYSEFRVDPTEMACAYWKHDTGRLVAVNDEEQDFHAIIGSEYLRERGEDRIATIINGHLHCPERVKITGYKGLNWEDLLPEYWQQVLITNIDSIVDNTGIEVGVVKRVGGIRDRYKGKLGEKAIEEAYERIEGYDMLVTTMENRNYEGDLSEFEFL